jgi:hypothetical protein
MREIWMKKFYENVIDSEKYWFALPESLDYLMHDSTCNNCDIPTYNWSGKYDYDE